MYRLYKQLTGDKLRLRCLTIDNIYFSLPPLPLIYVDVLEKGNLLLDCVTLVFSDFLHQLWQIFAKILLAVELAAM